MAFESGIRALRLEFVRETTRGTTPTNPDWLLYSDAVQSFTVSPTGSINPRGNIGTPDVVNFNAGTESHEFSLAYDLQQWFAAAGDASYDGMHRIADGSLPAAHSVVGRAAAGDSGVDGAGSRIYYVGTGALVNTVSLAGEPESGEPIMVTLDYMCEKLRAYQIDQPAATGVVSIVSTSALDTTQSVEVEDDGAAASETIGPLTGTTPVVGAVSFPTIDSAFLDAECVGNVTLSISGSDLMTIYGSASYGDREGDLGIPSLGTGSHGAAIAGDYENILGDTIERPTSTPLGIDAEISSVSMSVENNIEGNSTIHSIGKALSEGPRTINLSATLFGPTASYDAMMDHLRAVESDIVWTLTGGTLTLVGAAMTSMGQITRDTGLAVMTVDNTFQGKSLTIS